ncbi:metalloregulator ArsR/SmtB family transcription factor [Alkalicoccobacillus porphyridii]|uniref:Metalloregulator ArsR/SmtB family transcription factor n=1 Tax=Alkalicoccobacillus porphyridii TaxID=2597270 RepID=A0A553ZXD7_9BACI|nr:metalloregulator ArsR/SmtB family transcription factor [Alkalicoccobacillus porphyridii]TSB46118.1 metalloregulator ArsR/SmtB family transcription factor [Alkalicoccobacillus porphyridii]
MQISRMVNFHKVMGDTTRIQIISMLKRGPLHGQAIAGKLGLKPPTISHHMSKLKEIDVVRQSRDKNTIYYHLNEKTLQALAMAVTKIGEDEVKQDFVMAEEEKSAIIRNFFTHTNQLKTFPAQRKKKLVVLEYMLRGLKEGEVYEEKEINEHIKQFFADYATIRREWIICHFMNRNDGAYKLNPKEMWLL